MEIIFRLLWFEIKVALLELYDIWFDDELFMIDLFHFSFDIETKESWYILFAIGLWYRSHEERLFDDKRGWNFWLCLFNKDLINTKKKS